MAGSLIQAQMPDGKTSQPVQTTGSNEMRTADGFARNLLEQLLTAQREQVLLLKLILSKLGE